MIGPILRRAEAGRLPSRREVFLMLDAQGNQYQSLLATAQRICQKQKGEEPALRGLVTINKDTHLDFAVEEGVSAWRLGCTSVAIRHDGQAADAEAVAALIRQIREQTGLRVALCLGECPYETYALWRQAGAAEYVLPHECCHSGLYARIHPGHSPADRLTRYLWLNGLGYEVTGGLRIGLEGQTLESLADDLEILRNVNVSGVVLRPVDDTPEVLRMVAITRLCLPQADLWLATDSTTLQAQALSCGASLIVASLPGESPDTEALPFAMAQAL